MIAGTTRTMIKNIINKMAAAAAAGLSTEGYMK